jgi:hypothetical protein
MNLRTDLRRNTKKYAFAQSTPLKKQFSAKLDTIQVQKKNVISREIQPLPDQDYFCSFLISTTLFTCILNLRSKRTKDLKIWVLEAKIGLHGAPTISNHEKANHMIVLPCVAIFAPQVGTLPFDYHRAWHTSPTRDSVYAFF